MIYLVEPRYLLIILLIPFFFIAYYIAVRLRKKRVTRFGQTALVEALTPNVSRKKGWVKLLFLSIALFFFAIAMARPQIGATLKQKEIKGSEIMIVLDVSNSMLAEDYSPNRLERAKLAISRLVDELSQDRIGLIIFAGRSFVQLPITSDYVSAKIFLNSIGTESVPVQGTAMGEAIYTAIRSFTTESEGSRAIIVVTDGENHEDDPIAAAKDAVEMGAKVYCIGVGSAQGKPIPMDGELLKDKDGNIVVSRLDEQTLREVAAAGEGIYVRAGNSEFGFTPIIEEIRSFEARQYQSVVFEEFDEQYMYFLALSLIFLLIEFFIPSTRMRRNIFKTGGKAAVVLCLFLLPTSLSAQDLKSELRKGNKEFEEGRFRDAELSYKRALSLDSLSAIAKYNLGNALYRSESYEEAGLYLKDLGDTLKALSPQKAADFYHNSGNLAIKNKDYQAAVDAYKSSLRLRPDDMETKANLAYAQQMLKNQQEQPQPQEGQDQQNQDQNRDNQENQDQEDENKEQQDPEQQKQNPDQQDPNRGQQNPQGEDEKEAKISPQAAEQLLQAIEDKEKETQEKVKKALAEEEKAKEKDKNW